MDQSTDTSHLKSHDIEASGYSKCDESLMFHCSWKGVHPKSSAISPFVFVCFHLFAAMIDSGSQA